MVSLLVVLKLEHWINDENLGMQQRKMPGNCNLISGDKRGAGEVGLRDAAASKEAASRGRALRTYVGWVRTDGVADTYGELAGTVISLVIRLLTTQSMVNYINFNLLPQNLRALTVEKVITNSNISRLRICGASRNLWGPVMTVAEVSTKEFVVETIDEIVVQATRTQG